MTKDVGRREIGVLARRNGVKFGHGPGSVCNNTSCIHTYFMWHCVPSRIAKVRQTVAVDSCTKKNN